jgi:hypothetical protein
LVRHSDPRPRRATVPVFTGKESLHKPNRFTLLFAVAAGVAVIAVPAGHASDDEGGSPAVSIEIPIEI